MNEDAPDTRDTFAETLARRALLSTKTAPLPRHDAISTLSQTAQGIAVRLRYVPDREILITAGFEAYLIALHQLDPATLEERAQIMLEDVNDQVIPSWLEVRMTYVAGDIEHRVRIEERQPHWNDRGLLDRIGT